MKTWAPPAFYCLHEVRNGTGYGIQEGYADVLAMSVWPSRGLRLIGAELKISRSDWIHELKNPAKAERFVKHTHNWYLITANDAAKIEEIPPTWGWMVAGDKGLKTMKAAPDLTPELPSWRLMASIFRNIASPMQDMVAKSEVEKLVAEGIAQSAENLRSTIDSIHAEKQKAVDQHYKLRAAINAFSSASGIHLDNWTADEEKYRAEAMRYRAFKEGGCQSFLKEINDMKGRIQGLLSYCDRLLDEKPS